MTTSQKLVLDDTFYFEEIRVYGLISDVPGYRLCFFLNEALDLRLVRSAEDKKKMYKNTPVAYSRYVFEDPNQNIHWFLTANKNPVTLEDNHFNGHSYIISGLPLVNTLKTMDHFLLMEGECSRDLVKGVEASLKEMPQVRAFEKIDITRTRNIHDLLPH